MTLVTGTKTDAPVQKGLVRRVVVPVGGSDSEYLVQQQAVEFASALDADVVAIHATPAPDEVLADVFRYVRDEAKKWNVDLEELVPADSDVARAICDELDANDLVIMGSSRIGTRYHLSSVAEAVLHHAPCPVQIVRQPNGASNNPNA